MIIRTKVIKGGDEETFYAQLLAQKWGTPAFSVDGVTYQFSDGMTWSAFVSSAYNTGGFTVSNNYVYADNGTKRVYYSGSEVLGDETIVSGRAYVSVGAYTITFTATNLTLDPRSESSVMPNGTAYVYLTASTGYSLPTTVTVNNTTVGDSEVSTGVCTARYQVRNDTGIVMFKNPTANIVGAAVGVSPAYTITSTLSNATIYQVLVDGVAVPSLPSTINGGSSLSVVFAPSTHYTMDGATYSGTMGNTSLANNYQYDSVNDRLNLNIADVEGNISISVSAALREYSITGAITNGALDPQYDSTITYGAVAYFGIVPTSSAYTYPAQSAITVTGATITAYDSATGVGTIANPTGNVTITATCPASAVTYTLTNTLSNVTVTSVVSSKFGTLAELPAFVYDDDTLTIQFTANSGYSLPTSVTVNGYSVPENTATATYGTCVADYGTTTTTGTITLMSFTGAVSFSVTAQSAPVGYVIPAGTYYGKASPSISSLQSEVSMPLSLIYTSNNVSYNNMLFSKDFRGRLYIEYGQNNEAYSASGGWTTNYRTITVSQNTTVTQEKYEAFFAVYDRMTIDIPDNPGGSN